MTTKTLTVSIRDFFDAIPASLTSTVRLLAGYNSDKVILDDDGNVVTTEEREVIFNDMGVAQIELIPNESLTAPTRYEMRVNRKIQQFIMPDANVEFRDAVAAGFSGDGGINTRVDLIARETAEQAQTDANTALQKANDNEDLIGDIRQLPEYPAISQRDNKVPKFSGDELVWEIDDAGTSVDQTARDSAADAQSTADAALPKAGGIMTGKIILDGAPTDDLHPATKKYADDIDDKIGQIRQLPSYPDAGQRDNKVAKFSDVYADRSRGHWWRCIFSVW